MFQGQLTLGARGAGSTAASVVVLATRILEAAASQPAADWETAHGAVAQAEAIRLRVEPLVEIDASRYAEARSVLANPGDLPDDERDDRLGEAIAEAAGPPLQIAEGAADCAELAALVAEEGNDDIRADALAAATFATAAAEVSLTLVEINLTAVKDDARVGRARELVRYASAARERAAATVGLPYS